jgi:hypothetical protein
MKTLVLAGSRLFASTGAASRGAAGPAEAGSAALATIEELSRLCVVLVVVPSPWWERAGPPWDRAAADSRSLSCCRVVRPVYWPLPGRPAGDAASIAHALRRPLERLRGAFRFESILAVGAFPNAVAAALLARVFGCPLVTLLDGDDLAATPHASERASAIRQALGQSHRIVAAGEPSRERALAFGVAPGKIAGDDTAQLPPAPAELDERPGRVLAAACYAALASAAGVSGRSAPAPRT